MKTTNSLFCIVFLLGSPLLRADQAEFWKPLVDPLKPLLNETSLASVSRTTPETRSLSLGSLTPGVGDEELEFWKRRVSDLKPGMTRDWVERFLLNLVGTSPERLTLGNGLTVTQPLTESALPNFKGPAKVDLGNGLTLRVPLANPVETRLHPMTIRSGAIALVFYQISPHFGVSLPYQLDYTQREVVESPNDRMIGEVTVQRREFSLPKFVKTADGRMVAERSNVTLHSWSGFR